MTKEELLTEIDDLLRTMPPMATFHHDTEENLSWLGRLAAVLNQWNSPHMIYVNNLIDLIQSPMAVDIHKAFRGITITLHRARHELALETIGPLTVAISSPNVFH